MTEKAVRRFDVVPLAALTIEDESSFRHVGVYRDLKDSLVRDGYTFRVLQGAQAGRWDRALCLNLTFWGGDAGGDVLVSHDIAADVVAHVAWHHLAMKALRGRTSGAPSAEALFLGESIASAFDVYLVGRLLGHALQSSFLETQVPAMADAAHDAGLSEEGFEELLARVARDPEGAFESLRALLFDVTRELTRADGIDAALETFERYDAHPYAALLHRFELSNWVLYARAYAPGGLASDPVVAEIDAALRGEGGGLAWLTERWLSR